MRKYKLCFIHEQGIRCAHPLPSPAIPFVETAARSPRRIYDEQHPKDCKP